MGGKENDRKYSSHELERPINDSRGKAGYGFPVSRSPVRHRTRICHAPTNLPSTSSILGHFGSTGNYNIGLLNESLRLWPRGAFLGTLTRSKASGLSRAYQRCSTCLENEHVPPVASDRSLEPWICLNLDNVDPHPHPTPLHSPCISLISILERYPRFLEESWQMEDSIIPKKLLSYRVRYK